MVGLFVKQQARAPEPPGDDDENPTNSRKCPAARIHEMPISATTGLQLDNLALRENVLLILVF